MVPSFALQNKRPNSDSAADDATIFNAPTTVGDIHSVGREHHQFGTIRGIKTTIVAACIVMIQVGGIAVDEKLHVACMVCDFCIMMCCHII